MKAIRKKYGKSKWIDTPLSRHYKSAVNSIKFMSRLQCVSLTAVGAVQYQKISYQLHNIDKKAELCRAALSTATAISEALTKAGKDIKSINNRYGVK